MNSVFTKGGDRLILPLDDKFRVESAKHNFTLQKYEEIVSRKDDSVRYDWKDIGYFGSNLAYCLKRYIVESLRDEEDTDVHRLLDRLKELENVIEKKVRKENILLELKE